jgi:5-methyltetrahydrofolate--homocysteine methyltransferase
MKAAVAHLEPHMERTESGGRGRIVIGTVKGDVHDIGKNLVDIILTNNGYEVHNLGIKVPMSELLAKADEVEADAIGMSGLLVKSTLIMRENLEELNRLGKSDYPVILGGAALTRTYVEKDLRNLYKGRVFYGKDAFEGLHLLDRLMEIKRSGVEDPSFGSEPSGRKLPPRRSEQLSEEDPAAVPARSPEVGTDNELFEPPFLGTRIAKGMPLDDITSYLNETALFRNQWGYRPEAGETDAEFKERIRAELRGRLDEAKADGLLAPQVVWGYFPVNAQGNDLIVYTDDLRTAERMRFSFPRQRKAPYLCIADFFRPADSQVADYAAFQIVTVGAAASARTAELFASNRYRDYVVTHGLSVEMTEALAELWHRRVREEWGFADQDAPTLTGLFRQQHRGGRYSFGYPACPDLEDNAKVVDLLSADRVGVSVSEGFQLYPEQTTLAIICHHPKAKYFVV